MGGSARHGKVEYGQESSNIGFNLVTAAAPTPSTSSGQESGALHSFYTTVMVEGTPATRDRCRAIAVPSDFEAESIARQAVRKSFRVC